MPKSWEAWKKQRRDELQECARRHEGIAQNPQGFLKKLWRVYTEHGEARADQMLRDTLRS